MLKIFLLPYKTSYKSIGIYRSRNITIKKYDDYENINSVNLLYLIIVKADGYIEENIVSKYLVFPSTDGNKKVLIKFTKLWNELNILLRQSMKVKKLSRKNIS